MDMTISLDRLSLISNQEKNSQLKIAGISRINETVNSIPIDKIKRKPGGDIFGQNM